MVLLFANALASLAIQAATVGSVDGANISVQSSGETFNLNDLYFTVSADGARHSVIKIVRVDGSDVEATVIKGHPSTGEVLALRPRKKVSPGAGKPDSPQAISTKAAPPNLWRWGAGLSYFTLAMPSTSGATAGYNLGFSLLLVRNFEWDRNISFDTGLRYYRAGASFSGSGFSGNVTLDYLAALGAANYVVLESPIGKLRVKGGLDLSYLLGSSENFNFGTASVSSTNPVSAKTDLLLLGGVDYIFKEGGWWVEATYNYGLLNVSGTSINVTNQGLIVLGGGSF